MRNTLFYNIIVVSCLLLFSLVGSAQNDSTILTYNEYIKNVLTHHPMAQRADLQTDFAEARWLSARGKFDPKLTSSWSEKNFDGKHYYKVFEAGFKIPTWYGLSVSGGYENTDGVFLNPENKTDKHGLWAAGIEANLLQGLLIDERRAALKQAEVYQKSAANERKIMLNQLLLAASQSYINWQLVFNNQIVIEGGIDLAEEYLEATRQLFRNGDKPAIDTLEAFLIVQDRLLRLQTNEIQLVTAKQQLENYLWYEQVPLELQSTTVPQDMSENNLDWIDYAPLTQMLDKHPDILEKELKRAQYGIEGRMKRDKLKPKLKLKYNPLLQTSENGIAPNYALSNYKWGFEFSMPLLMRSEKAAIAENQLKIREVEYDILDKRNTILNKVEANLAKQSLLQRQVNLQSQNVSNYKRLLDAERTKFDFGESSVFLLNKRQEKYLESSIKLTELIAKYQMANVEYLFFRGDFLDVME
ncbi:MAG: TolC family protein [Chitinophagales bacterium]